MSTLGQCWLVARREIRERSRSKGLWVGTAIMLVAVVAAVVVPSLVGNDRAVRDVGFTGAIPAELSSVLIEQGKTVDVTVRVNSYDDVAAGEQALRDKGIDVLVIGGQRLEWRGDADQRLRALLTGAIQLVGVHERAVAAGITPDQLAALAAPVPVENDELGITAGRSPDDETAAYLMSILLLVAVATYGQLVLTGVVQEKSSRVVEVLLARMPARTLLAGKVAGIGLIGFAQFVVTALAAVIAALAVESVDIPAIGADVLAWVVVWFVLGYAVYAMAYGAFGSLASRTEDASAIATPVTTVLIVGYWASLIAVASDPEGVWAVLVSFFPATAAFAMPGRVALGAVAWWEPVIAAGLSLVAIAGLVAFAGRVYSGAILHTGATLKLHDAWHGTTTPAPKGHTAHSWIPRRTPRTEQDMTSTRQTADVWINAILVVIGATAGTAVAVLASDVVIGIAVGAGVYAAGSRIAKARHHHAAR